VKEREEKGKGREGRKKERRRLGNGNGEESVFLALILQLDNCQYPTVTHKRFLLFGAIPFAITNGRTLRYGEVMAEPTAFNGVIRFSMIDDGDEWPSLGRIPKPTRRLNRL